MTRRGWGFVAALLVPSALAAGWLLHNGPGVDVRKATVTTGPIVRTLLTLGTLETSDAAGTRSAPGASTYQPMPGEDADAQVLPMQVLVNLDDSDLNELRLFESATFTLSAYPLETFRGVFSEVRPVPPPLDRSSGVSSSPRGDEDESTGCVAIVDVGNPDARLAPGMTALVALPGESRSDVVRIPNDALTFDPPEGTATQAIGESPGVTVADKSPDRQHHVWTFDGQRFRSIPVHVGLSDDEWTELVGGEVHPGDQVVVSATAAGSRLHR